MFPSGSLVNPSQCSSGGDHVRNWLYRVIGRQWYRVSTFSFVPAGIWNVQASFLAHEMEHGAFSKGPSVKDLPGTSLLISGLPGDDLVDSSEAKRVD